MWASNSNNNNNNNQNNNGNSGAQIWSSRAFAPAVAAASAAPPAPAQPPLDLSLCQYLGAPLLSQDDVAAGTAAVTAVSDILRHVASFIKQVTAAAHVAAAPAASSRSNSKAKAAAAVWSPEALFTAEEKQSLLQAAATIAQNQHLMPLYTHGCCIVVSQLLDDVIPGDSYVSLQVVSPSFVRGVDGRYVAPKFDVSVLPEMAAELFKKEDITALLADGVMTNGAQAHPWSSQCSGHATEASSPAVVVSKLTDLLAKKNESKSVASTTQRYAPSAAREIRTGREQELGTQIALSVLWLYLQRNQRLAWKLALVMQLDTIDQDKLAPPLVRQCRLQHLLTLMRVVSEENVLFPEPAQRSALQQLILRIFNMKDTIDGKDNKINISVEVELPPVDVAPVAPALKDVNAAYEFREANTREGVAIPEPSRTTAKSVASCVPFPAAPKNFAQLVEFSSRSDLFTTRNHPLTAALVRHEIERTLFDWAARLSNYTSTSASTTSETESTVAMLRQIKREDTITVVRAYEKILEDSLKHIY